MCSVQKETSLKTSRPPACSRECPGTRLWPWVPRLWPCCGAARGVRPAQGSAHDLAHGLGRPLGAAQARARLPSAERGPAPTLVAWVAWVAGVAGCGSGQLRSALHARARPAGQVEQPRLAFVHAHVHLAHARLGVAPGRVVHRHRGAVFLERQPEGVVLLVRQHGLACTATRSEVGGGSRGGELEPRPGQWLEAEWPGLPPSPGSAQPHRAAPEEAQEPSLGAAEGACDHAGAPILYRLLASK